MNLYVFVCVCVFEILLSYLFHLEQPTDKNSLKQKASSPQGEWEQEKKKGELKWTWKLPSARITAKKGE